MSNWKFRTIIVPAARRQLISEICSLVMGVAGEGMFSSELSTSGSGSASHYISSGQIHEEMADLLPLYSFNFQFNEMGQPPTIEKITKQGDAQAIVNLAAEKEVSLSLQEVSNCLQELDCSEQEPFTALDRLSLKIVQKELV